jgi:hypothetical protein
MTSTAMGMAQTICARASLGRRNASGVAPEPSQISRDASRHNARGAPLAVASLRRRALMDSATLHLPPVEDNSPAVCGELAREKEGTYAYRESATLGDHHAWCMLAPTAMRVTLDDCAAEPIIDLRPLGEEAWIHLWPFRARPMFGRASLLGFLCGCRRALTGRIGDGRVQ